MSKNTHDAPTARGAVRMGSDRVFGFVFAGLFSVIGLWPLTGGNAPRVWSLVLALIFLIAAVLLPKALRPLNRLWFRFGLLLHKIVAPVVMGLLFIVAVTPTALIMRLLGKDPLRLRKDPALDSYWIRRDVPGPQPDTMKNQF